MNKKIAALVFMLVSGFASQAQIVPKKGMVITQSLTFRKGVYNLNGFDNRRQGAIVIRGSNLTIDFNHLVMKGSTDKKTPDAFDGVAVYIEGGKNITLKNLTAKGYKIALLARHVNGLTIENCDFSYNYRQHLNSTQEKEDISDWLSHHHNEKDEWLRYGAAIYLRGCSNAIISGNRVTGGQNALMMTECNLALIYNNDFSFNSGLGMAFYRSSNNKVLHNRLNFNVRGYSHGVYNRGQDSAGFLVYEQSSGNVFFKNSATHSGDGFFLWAGQTTMDTGRGGCNDNQILYNDFSYAPTNGVEVTFSRNTIAHNRIFECDNGIWGGYSFQSAFTDNQLRNNRVAIAIEHGQHNEISGNTFLGNKEVIKLWSRPQQPADWGYAKYRDTRSVDYRIAANTFSRNETVFNLHRTDSLFISANSYAGNGRQFLIDSTVSNLDSSLQRLYDTASTDYNLANGIDPFKGNGRLAGRQNIRITEWGPYDFRYPLLWNKNPIDSSGQMEFELLGPKGKWRILSARGVIANRPTADTFPAALSVTKQAGAKQDISIVAEYRGPAFTDAFGNRVPANKPFLFRFTKFFQPIPFQVKWFACDSSVLTDPKKMALAQQEPVLKTETVSKLDYVWWGGLKTADSTYRQFLTVAEGEADIDQGLYELSLTWDDAVRVYVDGKRVIDEWNPSRHSFDEAPNRKLRLSLGGKHRFRIEHVELGGFAALALKLTRLN